MLVEGQIEGGAAQGLGLALMEEFFPGGREPSRLSDSDDWRRAGGRALLIEDASSVGPFGAKGVGEQALIPTAPAILNAIYDAAEVRIRRAPATPGRVRPRFSRRGEREHARGRRQDPVRRLPCAVLHSRGDDGRVRPLRQSGRPIGARRSACAARPHGREGGKVVPFIEAEGVMERRYSQHARPFVTAVGAGTTYPDYKPAPFIVSSKVDGVDMVTVVTEGIYSYCGVKVKIDTDRHLGAEHAPVRAEGEPVGHVTTGEYGSQMLSLGGVNHLTHGGKKEGRVTCDTLLDLCKLQAGRAHRRRRRERDRASRQGADHQRHA